MNIAHTALYTDRFEETIRFYEAAFGAESLGTFQALTKGCWLKIGESILEIFESEQLPPEGAFKHIAIGCEDVDRLYEKALSCGGTAQTPPREITLGLKEPKRLRIAFVRGVNGEQIELCTEL